jgi:hypothetical protein
MHSGRRAEPEPRRVSGPAGTWRYKAACHGARSVRLGRPSHPRGLLRTDHICQATVIGVAASRSGASPDLVGGPWRPLTPDEVREGSITTVTAAPGGIELCVPARALAAGACRVDVSPEFLVILIRPSGVHYPDLTTTQPGALETTWTALT